MAYSALAARAAARLRASLARGGRRRVVGAALLALGACRLLPASWLAGLDGWFGRPGDTLLALAALLLLASAWLARAPAAPAPADADAAAVDAGGAPAALCEQHARLEQAIDQKLGEVIDDTEGAALAIMQQVRQLHDTSSRLVGYLEGTTLESTDLGRNIDDSVSCLREIDHFIAALPAKMARDLDSVQAVVAEIKQLSGMIESVRAISMQSHLLAINAEIEASRAGSAGLAFKVVANEMRHLAGNSGAVAAGISAGLARARAAVENGMAASLAESSQQFEQVSNAGAAIQKVQDNFDDMSQYYKTRFLVVTKHNHDLSKEIAEVLGQSQAQDVVRQAIDRIRGASGRRDALLREAFARLEGAAAFAQLPLQLATLCDDYLAEEARHLHSARAESDGGELKIELF